SRSQRRQATRVMPVDGGPVPQSVIAPPRRAHLSRRTGHAPPIRVKYGRASSTRISQEPPGILHGPHTGLPPMLGIRTAVPIPPVVRNVYYHLGAVRHELAYFIRENRFVANEHA